MANTPWMDQALLQVPGKHLGLSGTYDFSTNITFILWIRKQRRVVLAHPRHGAGAGWGRGVRVLSDSKAGFSVASSPDPLCLTATLQDCVMIPVPQM